MQLLCAVRGLLTSHLRHATAASAVGQVPRGLSSRTQPVGYYTPITKQLWDERIASAERDAASSRQTSAEQRKAARPTAVTYPFAANSPLKELYRNPWNKIRIGSVLEDLDSLAGNVAFAFCCKPGFPPPLLVTASVDEIHLHRSIDIEDDIHVTGQVVWTGKSSLDIQITLWQRNDADPSLMALFSFVHLDSETKRPSPVVQLLPGTDAERALSAQRQAVADARRAERQAKAQSGREVPAEALKWQAAALKEARALMELPALAAHDAVLVSSSSLENTFITQPQQQNMHGRIFGGFLMRRAFELAFSTTYAFAGDRPEFVKVDEVAFVRPVDVGDLLRFKSKVMHTVRYSASESLLFVDVEASVAKPESRQISNTNIFSFVFRVVSSSVRRVLPGSEEEAARAYQCMSAVQEVQQLLLQQQSEGTDGMRA